MVFAHPYKVPPCVRPERSPSYKSPNRFNSHLEDPALAMQVIRPFCLAVDILAQVKCYRCMLEVRLSILFLTSVLTGCP